MSDEKKCSTCGGSGQVEVTDEWPLFDCFPCRGTGKEKTTAGLEEVMLQKNGKK